MNERVIRILEAVVGYHPRLDNPEAAAPTVVTFCGSLLLARLLHEGVEKPGRRLLLGRPG